MVPESLYVSWFGPVGVCLASRSCGVAVVVFVLVVVDNVQNTLPQLVCAFLAAFYSPVHMGLDTAVFV